MIFRRSARDTDVTPAGVSPTSGDPTEDPDATEVRPNEEPAAEQTAATAVDPEATVVRPPNQGHAADDPEATVIREPDPTPTDPAVTEEPVKTKPRRRGRKIALGVGIGVVVLAGAYVGAAWYLGDRVPQSTTVAGVDISGLPVPEAVERLETELAGLTTEPVPIQLGETSASLDPAQAGLTFDAVATVEEFTGFTLEPQVVLGHLFGLGSRQPVVDVDDDALTAALETAATDLNKAPVEGVIELAEGAATVAVEPEDGVAVDVPAAAELLAGEWLTGQRPFELPSVTTEPEIDDEEIAAAMSDIVDPLLSGPVTVQLNEEQAVLEPAVLVEAATLSPGAAGLELTIDGQALADHITAAVPSVGETPQDAQIVFDGGVPTIIPAVTGTGLDPDQLALVVGEAVTAEGDARVAVAELAATEADFTTEEAEALGVVEVVGEYATPYPYDPTRTQNLVNGTAHINGTLVLPGEEFSLIEALGPITTANGYVSSGVVENGFATTALGGGLSQVSTTTFNAAYEAGMQDIEHKPHSRWFERYPPGREATIYAPSLDMRWGNNTPYGVLVQAWVGTDDKRVHVRLWSTSYWDVEITSSEKYRFTSPRTVYNTSPQCTPESGGASGFTIDIRRTISLDGEVNDEYSDSYSWTYSPWNRVVCGEPPSEDDEAETTEAESTE
jgi:vancomycin resistance protein YoaR